MPRVVGGHRFVDRVDEPNLFGSKKVCIGRRREECDWETGSSQRIVHRGSRYGMEPENQLALVRNTIAKPAKLAADTDRRVEPLDSWIALILMKHLDPAPGRSSPGIGPQRSPTVRFKCVRVGDLGELHLQRCILSLGFVVREPAEIPVVSDGLSLRALAFWNRHSASSALRGALRDRSTPLHQ